jgi:hypothetical protein
VQLLSVVHVMVAVAPVVSLSSVAVNEVPGMNFASVGRTLRETRTQARATTLMGGSSLVLVACVGALRDRIVESPLPNDLALQRWRAAP